MANKTLLWVGVAGLAGVLAYEYFKKQKALAIAAAGGGSSTPAASPVDTSTQDAIQKGLVEGFVSQMPTKALWYAKILPDMTTGMWSMLAEMTQKRYDQQEWNSDDWSFWQYLKDTYNGGANLNTTY